MCLVCPGGPGDVWCICLSAFSCLTGLSCTLTHWLVGWLIVVAAIVKPPLVPSITIFSIIIIIFFVKPRGPTFIYFNHQNVTESSLYVNDGGTSHRGSMLRGFGVNFGPEESRTVFTIEMPEGRLSTLKWPLRCSLWWISPSWLRVEGGTWESGSPVVVDGGSWLERSHPGTWCSPHTSHMRSSSYPMSV